MGMSRPGTCCCTLLNFSRPRCLRWSAVLYPRSLATSTEIADAVSRAACLSHSCRPYGLVTPTTDCVCFQQARSGIWHRTSRCVAHRERQYCDGCELVG